MGKLSITTQRDEKNMSYRTKFYSPREIVLIHMRMNQLDDTIPYLDARSCQYDREGAYGAVIERKLVAHGYAIPAISEAFVTLITDEDVAEFNARLTR